MDSEEKSKEVIFENYIVLKKGNSEIGNLKASFDFSNVPEQYESLVLKALGKSHMTIWLNIDDLIQPPQCPKCLRDIFCFKASLLELFMSNKQICEKLCNNCDKREDDTTICMKYQIYSKK